LCTNAKNSLRRFWDGTWPELCQVLPNVPGLAVDLGAGEGRSSRELLRLGYSVVAVERSQSLALASCQREGAAPVIQADAAHLPLSSESVDCVVACMSLQDIDDLQGAISESARVLKRGGQMCATLVHPFVTARDPATFHTDDYVFTDPYLRERRYEDKLERDGLTMTFVSMHRPLSTYVEAWTAAGLVITRMREFGARAIPWLLTVALEKRG